MQQQINKRETLLLNIKDLEDALNNSYLNDSTGKLPPNVRTGGRVYTNQNLKQPSSPQLSRQNPPGRGYINPDLTQQIRNNMFVLLDAFKVMRASGLANAQKVEFQQTLGLTNMPLDNLDVVVLLLKNSPHTEVQSLEQHIIQFLREADHCLNLVAEPPTDLTPEAITNFDEKFAHMLTMAKTVIESCKYV